MPRANHSTVDRTVRLVDSRMTSVVVELSEGIGLPG